MFKKFVFSALLGMIPLQLLHAYESPLRRVCANTQPPGQNAELSQALSVVNSEKFNSPKKRKDNKDSYLQAIKKVIQSTTSGAHLIDCLEDNSDTRFEKNTDFIIDSNLDVNATFEYEPSSTPGKHKRSVRLLASENPMAAITFLAHEMQHSCNASVMLSAEQNEDQAGFEQVTLVDEVRSYKLQASFFLELARQAPSLVCETTATSSKLFPGQSFTLQDLMANVDEGIQDGTFYSKVIAAYLGFQIFTSEDHFYQDQVTESADGESSSTRIVRPDLIRRFESAVFKLTPP